MKKTKAQRETSNPVIHFMIFFHSESVFFMAFSNLFILHVVHVFSLFLVFLVFMLLVRACVYVCVTNGDGVV